jgi:pimeloyl-ACP methyl ester carboxylesterase
MRTELKSQVSPTNKMFVLLVSFVIIITSAFGNDSDDDAPRKEEVIFQNAGISLSGTLYYPKGEGPFPAVVFVHGSGPETRANSTFSAKWFASIGIAALIYDKRGTGKSQGDPTEVNRFDFTDLAGDLVAAINFLSEEPKIVKEQIGVHATSQGAWITCLAMSMSDNIKFIIAKSASVCTVEEDRIFERARRLSGEGFSGNDLSEVRRIQVEEPIISPDKEEDKFFMLFNEYKEKPWFKRVYPGPDPISPTLTSYRNWYKSVAHFDPLQYLSISEIPVFWIFGDPSLDNSAPVELSISNLENLKKSGKPYVIFQVDGQGHSIKEKYYERHLYDWLVDKLTLDSKFKKH